MRVISGHCPLNYGGLLLDKYYELEMLEVVTMPWHHIFKYSISLWNRADLLKKKKKLIFG